MQQLIQQLLTELRGIWRFRWRALTVAWAICGLGWYFVLSMPNIYEARAQVFVDADSRLVEVMGQVGVAPGVGATVFIVRQAMLGRPQLEKVARDTKLDLRASNDEEYDAIIRGLGDNISIDSGRASIGRNLYSISYRDRDREMAVAIVKTLLETFVTDVLAMNDQGSEQATGYLDDQLTYYGELLSGAEKGLAEFKKTNIGLLPGESGGIFERLQVEMSFLKQKRLELSIESDRREELRAQIRSENPNLPEGTNIMGPSGGVVTSPTDTTINELETRRSQLLLTYTERHPDIVAIGEQLEQLYKKRNDEYASMAQSSSGTEGFINASNPVYQNIQIALNQSSATIAGLSSEIAQHDAIVRDLNGQINTIPDVEAEYAQLNRNYQQYRSLYAELLVQKERERMGAAGDDREVVNFNVIEPPAAAMDPVAPKRTFFLFFVLCLGLGTGAAIGFLKHISNPVFVDVTTLRRTTGRPVLSAVSVAREDRTWATRLSGAASFAVACSLLILLGFLGIAFQDAAVNLVQSISAAGA